MSAEEYGSLFSKEFLDGGYVSSLPIDLNNVYCGKARSRISVNFKLEIRKAAEAWKDKFYPKTVKENKKIMHDYLSLCEANNIKPILFLPPMLTDFIESYPKNRLDEFYTILREILSRHPTAAFMDTWKIKGLTYDDFADNGHVNVVGAAKFSYILNQFVMQFERK